jgi:hypothetical protein
MDKTSTYCEKGHHFATKYLESQTLPTLHLRYLWIKPALRKRHHFATKSSYIAKIGRVIATRQGSPVFNRSGELKLALENSVIVFGGFSPIGR